MARLLRAAHSTRLKRSEISRTNIGSFLDTFEQVALLLEAARRFTRQLITFFGLSSTGLGEYHFRCIIRAVQNMQRLPAPGGRPDEDDSDMCWEMELQIQNVSGRTLCFPIHQVDCGGGAWDRDDTAYIDLVADEHQAQNPGRPQRCL